MAILDEWPRIRAEIDGGHPSVVGLIRTAGGSPWDLTRNHQVLAFAYAAGDRFVTLRVYDPNHPRRDDVELRASISGGRGRPVAGPDPPGPVHRRAPPGVLPAAVPGPRVDARLAPVMADFERPAD